MRYEEQEFLKALDLSYSYRLAKQMEKPRTNPVLGFRTAGSKAEFETGELLVREMKEIGLKDVTKDRVEVDVWEFHHALLSFQDQEGKEYRFQLGAYQTQFDTHGPREFSVVYVGKGTARDYEGLDVRGKLVLADINQRDEWWINFPVYQAKLKGAAALIAVQNQGYGEVDDHALNAQDIAGPADAPAFSISRADAQILKKELERGEIVGGSAHAQVLALADKIVEAVRTGAIRKFVVMAGCDGRAKSRSYYTDFARALPHDTVILTAGCAKYRYNKLDLGDIGGIPRVLDAGQCNDSYSLAVIALKLKEVFGLEDINDLPIVYNISWYEQKAVIVLLALLYLGVRDIHLGPTLPAFLSPNVAKVLSDRFGIAGIGTVEEDMALFFGA